MNATVVPFTKTMSVERDAAGALLLATFLRPSNFHAHLRRDELMRAIAKHLMQYVLYLLVMPNSGPIRTMAQAYDYFEELMDIARAEGFTQLKLIMTLYHTADITTKVIEEIAQSSFVRAIKHYPPEPGVTTGSGFGIPLDDPRSKEQFYAMAACGVPLLGHFESVEDKHGNKLHPRDGEAYFVREHLWRFRDENPDLRISCEHSSTVEMIEFVKADRSGNTFMTVTPHHSLCTEHDFERSWGTHLKCKPIVQTPDNRDAIVEFITSGDERVGAGDDTAAHLKSLKEQEFSKASNGAFWTWHGITAYAAAFEKAGALDERFERFMSLNAPKWWGLPPPADYDRITLYQETDKDIPEPVQVPELHDSVVPLGWTSESDRLKIGLAIR